MGGWDSALGKNKSAFHVLGWGRANREGPYVLTLPQERRGRIRAESGPSPVHLRPSFREGPAQLLSVVRGVAAGEVPQEQQRGMPSFSWSTRAKDLTGLSREHFTEKKHRVWCVKFHVLPAAHWSRKGAVCWHTLCMGKGEKGKSKPLRNTAMSRVAHISIILSFGLTAGKNP